MLPRLGILGQGLVFVLFKTSPRPGLLLLLATAIRRSWFPGFNSWSLLSLARSYLSPCTAEPSRQELQLGTTWKAPDLPAGTPAHQAMKAAVFLQGNSL